MFTFFLQNKYKYTCNYRANAVFPDGVLLLFTEIHIHAYKHTHTHEAHAFRLWFYALQLIKKVLVQTAFNNGGTGWQLQKKCTLTHTHRSRRDTGVEIVNAKQKQTSENYA